MNTINKYIDKYLINHNNFKLVISKCIYKPHELKTIAAYLLPTGVNNELEYEKMHGELFPIHIINTIIYSMQQMNIEEWNIFSKETMICKSYGVYNNSILDIAFKSNDLILVEHIMKKGFEFDDSMAIEYANIITYAINSDVGIKNIHIIKKFINIIDTHVMINILICVFRYVDNSNYRENAIQLISFIINNTNTDKLISENPYYGIADIISLIVNTYKK